MTFFGLVALVNAVTSLMLSIFVFIKKRKNYPAMMFALLTFIVFAWSLFYFIWQITDRPVAALFWTRVLTIYTFAIPVLFLHWILAWLNLTKYISRKIILLIGYVLTGVLIALSFTKWTIPNLIETPYYPLWPKAGPLYTFYIWVIYVGLFGIAFFELIRRYRQSKGLLRYQTRYVLLGTLFGFLGGATNFFLWYNVPIPPIGNIFVTFCAITLFYGFLRYRLMDLRSIASRLVVFVVDSIYTYLFFFFSVWLITNLYDSAFSKASYFSGLVIVPLFLLSLFKIDKSLTELVSSRLFKSLHGYQETITKLTRDLNRHIQLKKIIDLIVDTIKESMQLDRAGVLLVSPDTHPIRYQIAKVVGFDTNNGISLVEDNFLTKHLQETKRALARDELDALYKDALIEEEQKSIANLKEQMEHIEASLCIPLMSRDKIIGIIVLGSKLSGEAYTQEDFDLLSTLADQASMAIENAQLYQQVQNFYETLAERVDTQTAEIQKKNKHLEELINIKDDFLRIVNHQLNTPISIVKSSIAMIDEGTWDMQKGLEGIRTGFERISKTVSDFWRAFELEGKQLDMQFAKTNIASLVQQLIKEKSQLKEAQERKLALTVKASTPPPAVWCDPENITHVLSNLLDNAIFYTEKGGVTISYQLVGNDKQLKVNITDTGYGLTEEDKQRLFGKFARGASGVALKPNGSGLGLFISKKIVESNGGVLTCDSPGRGKGSTFSFTVPLYTNQQATNAENEIALNEKIIIFNQKS